MNLPTSVIWLRSMLQPDMMLHSPLDDGRALTWDAGYRIYCRVSFPAIVPGYFTIVEKEQRHRTRA